jgi:DnaK suppressor protein
MPSKGKSSRSKASKSGSKRKAASGRGGAVKERSKKLSTVRATLLERRAEIGRGMEHNLDNNDAPPLTRGDASDLAADALDSDTTLQLAERGSSEVAQIEEALRKIDEGTYGVCETCSEPIPWTRLQALPYATMCVKCKEVQEREGGSGMGVGWDAVDDLEDMDVSE